MATSSRPSDQGGISKLNFLALVVLLMTWSCDDSDTRPVTPYALCGPDTLERGAPLTIEFSYEAGTNGHFDSYSWAAANDTLLDLALYYSYSTSGGCATGIPSSFSAVGTAILRHTPDHSFSIRAGSLVFEVPVAPRVQAENRLRITLVDSSNQAIPGVGGDLDYSGVGGGSFQLVATDRNGVIFTRMMCGDSGVEYDVSLYSNEPHLLGRGRAHWPTPCTIPQHMLILGD